MGGSGGGELLRAATSAAACTVMGSFSCMSLADDVGDKTGPVQEGSGGRQRDVEDSQ
jgi:hypothetical protein